MAFSRAKFTFTLTASEHLTVHVTLEYMKVYYFWKGKTQDKRQKMPVNISLRNLNGRYRVA
jgi:hypothetical protein